MRLCFSTANFTSRNRKRGFTLMELMLTVALGALVIGFGIPSFRSMMSNSRLTTQSNEFIGVINYARSEAITRNATVTLCRAESESATECDTDDDLWPAWILLNAAGDVLRHGPINERVLVSSDLANQTVEFSSDGLARSGGGLIANATITTCVTQEVVQNIRIVTIGAGSRLSTTRDSGVCE